MRLIKVASSNVDVVGYDDESRTLEVRFLNGSTYRYFDVPNDVHLGLLAAPSIGSYLHGIVKPRYRCEKVADTPPSR